MSFALVKNLAFPSPPERQDLQGIAFQENSPNGSKEATARVTGRFSLPTCSRLLLTRNSEEMQYPTPGLCEKRNDSSWLSCESNIDLELNKPGSSANSTSSLRKCQPKQKRKFSWKPSPRMTSDAIIGLSDGMTVPFALTAGLASLGDTRLVMLGGLAELIAGAISMGLGGLLGAKSEA